MSELALPKTEVLEVSDALQMWTHFLNPKGLQNHYIGHIDDPLVYSDPLKHNDEVAWTHIEHHARINLNVEGRDEVITSMRHQHGDSRLATGRDMDGVYMFQPLSQLIESEELPIYTASWLARYVKTWSRNRLTGEPTYPVEFLPLRDKPPFNTLLLPGEVKVAFPQEDDTRSERELRGIAIDERIARLASCVIRSYPYLEGWHKQREIPIQDEITRERVFSVLQNR